MPKTSLWLVRMPKKVLSGFLRLTFVPVVFWRMCLPSLRSSRIVSVFGGVFFYASYADCECFALFDGFV